MKGIESLNDACTGCFACYNACPKDAITMPEDKEGFYRPIINQSACINCNLCDRVCPILHLDNRVVEYKACFGYSTNSIIRNASSSGGAFSAVAQQVLDDDGIVYGAAFRYGDNLRVEHCSTEEVPLANLRKSKYVQSYVGDAFRRVKNDLGKGKKVLFVGSPCQVAGLMSFLGNKYDNLITVDFICHGVPPMNLLLKNLEYKRINKKKVKCIDFRYRNKNEKQGQGNNNINIDFNKTRHYTHPWQYDPYYYGFEKNITLRRSCYYCPFCNGKNKYADITLADFWGVKKYDPSLNVSEGISLILLNNLRHKEDVDNMVNNQFRLTYIDTVYVEYVYKKIRSKETNYDIEQRNLFYKTLIYEGYKKAVRMITLKQSTKERFSHIKHLLIGFIKK